MTGSPLGKIRVWFPWLVVLSSVCQGPHACGQTDPDAGSSILTLLPGFDRQRLADILQKNQSDDLAKLLARMKRVSTNSWRARAKEFSRNHENPANAPEEGREFQVGDLVAIDGKVDSIARMPVKESLREFVEMDNVFVLRIRHETEPLRTVLTDSMPVELKVGDGVDAVGVALGPDHLAATAWRWTPQSIGQRGHRLLAEGGFDLRGLESLRRRNRQPLRAADREAFYQWLFPIAESARRAEDHSRSEPDQASERLRDPVVLLRQPDRWIGRRFEMPLETVQVTKVFVPESAKTNESIGDSYFQIDAFAWLVDSEVIIKPAAGQSGDPVVFQNRFPVSVVTRSVPAAIDPGNDFQRSVRESIVVDGWLFRLWSYDTEATDNTDAKQFGPLIVAIEVETAAAVGRDPAGVRGLGYFAAAGVSLGILGAVGLAWSYRRSDRRRKSQRRHSPVVIGPPMRDADVSDGEPKLDDPPGGSQ